mmetsp:Transcript_5887/g.8891  ORF Transcript_5887/g.8891 Transcript_5887/m.8891 type:complete len:203 (-) Transcript_5887:356-964(-)
MNSGLVFEKISTVAAPCCGTGNRYCVRVAINLILDATNSTETNVLSSNEPISLFCAILAKSSTGRGLPCTIALSCPTHSSINPTSSFPSLEKAAFGIRSFPSIASFWKSSSDKDPPAALPINSVALSANLFLIVSYLENSSESSFESSNGFGFSFDVAEIFARGVDFFVAGAVAAAAVAVAVAAGGQTCWISVALLLTPTFF